MKGDISNEKVLAGLLVSGIEHMSKSWMSGVEIFEELISRSMSSGIVSSMKVSSMAIATFMRVSGVVVPVIGTIFMSSGVVRPES